MKLRYTPDVYGYVATICDGLQVLAKISLQSKYANFHCTFSVSANYSRKGLPTAFSEAVRYWNVCDIDTHHCIAKSA